MYETVAKLLPRDVKEQIKRHAPFLVRKPAPLIKTTEVTEFDRPYIKDGKMWFHFKPKAKIDTFSISVPDDFSCHNDLIATCIISIFGGLFKKVRLNFEVSTECVAVLEEIAGIEISTAGVIEPWQAGTTPFLAFSGGFDSLAGYLLCPGYYKLASIDFGGIYARERAFFETLDTTIIETDFRRTGDGSFHWMFMGAPLILHADYLNMSGIGFGTIFEAAPVHMQPAEYKHQPMNDFRRAVGLGDYTITKGLTEFATVRIIQKLAPDFAEASLKSLADEGSEKKYRKELLLRMELVRDGVAGNEVYDAISLPKNKVKIGKSFALDFLYYAFASSDAHETVYRVIENPEALKEFQSTGIDMSWVNAYNPSFINQIPYDKIGDTMNKLHEIGVPMFSQKDYENYSKFREYWFSKNS
ncbi:hypothetical protein [Ochrobactrum sp. EDr1-4]|uniref:hypothetical protein n=1 Tax=Ochrobactrum sp. EDr1-4 TaxID=3368622 RepID=UPI003BA38B0D